MSEHIERVARAICVAEGHDPDWFTANSPVVGQPAPQKWMQYVTAARAAIAAMHPSAEERLAKSRSKSVCVGVTPRLTTNTARDFILD